MGSLSGFGAKIVLCSRGGGEGGRNDYFKPQCPSSSCWKYHIMLAFLWTKINNEHAPQYWVSSAHIWRRDIQSHSVANRKPFSSQDFFDSRHKILSLRICGQFHYQHFHFSNPSPIYILIKSPRFQLFEISDFSSSSVLPKSELASQSCPSDFISSNRISLSSFI